MGLNSVLCSLKNGTIPLVIIDRWMLVSFNPTVLFFKAFKRKKKERLKEYYRLIGVLEDLQLVSTFF